jgi:predicted Zn-ribbon and HTH transcriptional regulator
VNNLNKKSTFGKYLFAVSVLFPVITVFVTERMGLFSWANEDFAVFVLFSSVVTIVMLAGMIFSIKILYGKVSSSKKRVLVVSRAKVLVKTEDNDVSEESRGGKIVFETEQGEMITLFVEEEGYNSISEDDLGVVFYDTYKNTGNVAGFFDGYANEVHKSTGKVSQFVKFEREGKSCNPTGERADEQCKTCGFVIHYDKFSVHSECKYCVGHNIKNSREASENAQSIKVRLNNFLVIAALSVTLLSFFVLVFTGVLRDSEYELIGVFGVFAVLVAVLIISIAIEARKVTERAFIVKCEPISKYSVRITLETERGETVTMVVKSKKCNFSVGDLGTLRYKSFRQRLNYSFKFMGEGKSVALNAAAGKRCKNCGGAIRIEDYKFNTEIICKYCNSTVRPVS